MIWPLTKSELLLNPRLPESEKEALRKAWDLHATRFPRHVGIVTSGSTGLFLGKIVLLSIEAIEASAKAAIERLHATENDVWLNPLPLFHVGGLGILVRAALSRSRTADYSEAWDPQVFHRRLEAHGVTISSLVPTQLHDLVEANLKAPSKLRAVVIGGARLSEDLRIRAIELGWPVLPSFGMTEASSQIATALTPHDPRLFPLAHVQVRASDGGRLEVKGASLLTATIEIAKDGMSTLKVRETEWFRTEDIGLVREDGSLEIKGRTGDFVKIAGEGVSLADLQLKFEEIARKLEFFDYALLAAKDDRLGAKIVLVSTHSDLEKAKLASEEFSKTVAPYAKIREVHGVEKIPRSALNKILRGDVLRLVGLELFT